MSIPGSGSPLLLATTAAAAADAAYVIPKSLRFSRDDTSALVKTPSSAGNRRTFTWSAWVKRSRLGIRQHLFNAGSNAASTDHTYIDFWEDDTLHMQSYSSNSNIWRIKTTQVFRDCSSFYHIVWVFDTTEGTASNRNKLYINGSQVTDLSVTTYPSQNYEGGVNAVAPHAIGKYAQDFGPDHFDGYMADVQFVDGEALQATDFGETRSSDGVWVPKEFTGFGKNPNDGTTWSSGTVTGTLFSGSSWTKAFDGELPSSLSVSNSAMSYNSTGDITLTLPKAISGTIRVYASSASGSTLGTDSKIVLSDNSEISCNILSSAPQFFTFGEKTNITSITLKQATAGVRLAGVEVDGHLLVDGRRDNSFHLNFSNSSTKEALGFDSAPTIPALDPKKGMDVITYTGTGSVRNIGGLNFEPGLVWIKTRNVSDHHIFYDSVRGPQKQLYSTLTNAEETETQGLKAFNPDGFGLGTGTHTVRGQTNTSSNTYVAWCWRAGGPAVSNTSGTITSQVSANTDYGFSIVSYTGNNTSGATVGHGLSSAPKWIVVKSRGQAGQFWHVYHASLAANEYIYLNSNAVKTSGNDFMNGTRPTSSVFSLGNGNGCNKSSDPVIAYCWSEVSGFSKFDGFNGDGNSGKKITTGFKPKFVIIKRTDTIENWHIFDSERGGTKSLFPDISNAEVDNSSRSVAFVSDGFTLGTQGGINASGGTYIYAAFADRPGNNWDVNNIVTNEGLTTSKTQFDVVTYTGNGGTQKIGGPSYSAHATNPSSYNGSAANLFDGNLSTSWQNTDTGGSTYASVDLTRGGASSGVAFTTSFEMYGAFSYNQVLEIVHAGGTHTYNGNPGGSGAWVDFASSLTSPVTTVRFKDSGGTGTPSWNAIRVDNEILIDGDDGPGLKFQPDFVWVKHRNTSGNHNLFDSVRGTGKVLFSNNSNAEGGTTGDLLGSFNSDGFTVNTSYQGGFGGSTNNNNDTYVAWCWKAGGTAVSNTDGSITSSVSANAQYGFSVVTYTGSAGGTVGHGLGKVPKLIIAKSRTQTKTWPVYTSVTGKDKYLVLNGANAAQSASGVWGSAEPTNAVFGIENSSTGGNVHGDIVAYCFADVPGYQRIGSYTGNGSTTGPVVVTGFKPRFILIKNTSIGNNWYMLDTERDKDNPMEAKLCPNLSSDENNSGNVGTAGACNINSNRDGFQIVSTSGQVNTSGETYVYLAIGDDEIGSDEDCLVDVPNAVTADADATDTTGGYQRGNYATLNPVTGFAASPTLSNGNLDVSTSGLSETWRGAVATIAQKSGKWYAEFSITAKTASNHINVGINPLNRQVTALQSDSTSGHYYNSEGKFWNANSYGGSYASYGAGDVIGVAVDMDTNDNVKFYKNGVLINTVALNSNITTYGFQFAVAPYAGGGSHVSSLSCNFGQMRFKYPIPSGYAAMNTTALPAATIADGSAHFATSLWTVPSGGADTTISGLSFAPDWLLTKNRSQSYEGSVYDTVRGDDKYLKLFSSSGSAAETTAATRVNLTSDGFVLEADNDNSNYTAGSASVGWTWNAGTSTVSNTDGSITSNVRANQSAGFSIVTYTGNGSAGATVGHGLNDAPSLIIRKSRSASASWFVYHSSLGATKYILLQATNASQTSTDAWNNTAPTSSVFSNGSDGVTNNVTFVAYCFAPVAGYSAFGSYTGNSSSDGVFVHTGFRPAWILLKRTDSGIRSWEVHDTSRSPSNVSENNLLPNTNAAESGGSARLDILSNGFKLRTSSNGINNGNIIYAAFAENPFSANGGLAR